jgi:hypothetical protein
MRHSYLSFKSFCEKPAFQKLLKPELLPDHPIDALRQAQRTAEHQLFRDVEIIKWLSVCQLRRAPGATWSNNVKGEKVTAAPEPAAIKKSEIWTAFRCILEKITFRSSGTE